MNRQLIPSGLCDEWEQIQPKKNFRHRLNESYPRGKWIKIRTPHDSNRKARCRGLRKQTANLNIMFVYWRIRFWLTGPDWRLKSVYPWTDRATKYALLTACYQQSDIFAVLP